VSTSTILGINLLANSGFEQGLDFWTTDHALIRSTDPSPYAGAAYLFGADDGSATSYTYQTLDLSATGFTVSEIASGSLVVKYGGWQSGWHYQTDSGKIEIIVTDSSSSVLYKADLDWFYSDNTWTLMQGSFALPTAAAQITFGFHAQRYSGWNTDGYLDDAFLVVNVYRNVVKGNSGANNLVGTTGPDDIFGYGGADTLHGGDGSDSLAGGADGDSLYGDGGADT
jgi:Ca2+-binding RTX toxin-like protein